MKQSTAKVFGLAFILGAAAFAVAVDQKKADAVNERFNTQGMTAQPAAASVQLQNGKQQPRP